MDIGNNNHLSRFLSTVANMYAENLRHFKPAKDYLEKRKIPENLRRTFNLGFATGKVEEIDYLYENQELALETGLLVKKPSGLRSYFWNRIMFPFYDLSGNCVGFTGRDIFGRSKAKYLNSKESSVFQKDIVLYGLYQSLERILRRRQVFIVEGNIDVLRMYQFDYPVVGLSSHNMSEYQIKILGGWYPDMFLMMDGDKAGKNGAINITHKFRELYNKGYKRRLPRLIELPKGSDPDTFLLKRANPEDYINEQIWAEKFAQYPARPKPKSNFYKNRLNNSSDPAVVKAMNDIVEIVSSRVELKKSGENWIGSCPFHDERTASFVVSPAKQIYKCFGCGVSGDILSFLMKYDNMNFRQAMEYLGGRV